MSPAAWERTKQKIETTLDQIFVEMPPEVAKVKAGILPHNAGHHGQYLSALQSLMMTLMGWCFYSGGMIMEALDDSTFTLEQCKKLVLSGNRNAARYTGYIAYPMVWNLWLEIEEALASIDSKDHLKALMVPWLSFVNRMHFWNVEIFPWHLAAHLPTRTAAEIGGRTYFTGKVAVSRSPST